ncbi:L-lactate permease [Cesiribacter andamanensis]|uniref:L-lactate permease n=1 Tax=Cesiribacter andamanensis AMV16 TaxID=1279009 RepID=M7N9E1_9BACT|nr:L-lactate permease [Cesiribacter andamanensis]EMR03877.1 L-lactate permease [Cesiribacter andamanensis AMV16]
MAYVLALLPIALLIVLSLLRSVKEAVLVAAGVTSGLFFYWGADLSRFIGTVAVAAVTSLNILMIVFGAAFLYNIMDKSGLIGQISHSLDGLHPSREIRFFLLAICLTAFFEGVAGFGTPGAIVPLLLIAMGFNAVLSVCVVLLFDGLAALFGAVGTPVLIGLQLPLGLDAAQLQQISLLSAGLGVLAAGAMLLFIFRLFARYQGPLQYKGTVVLLYLFFALPFCLLAYWVPELATVLGALSMLLLSILFLRRPGSRLELAPWLPYGLLAMLLLLPKLYNPLSRWIGWDIGLPNLFGSGISTSFKPLQSPLIPFLVVGLGVALYKRIPSLYLGDALQKILRVVVVLFPSILVAQLMINSGQTQPSMIGHISELLSGLGSAYPLLAPFIGVIGAFITGSTTISNVVFGASQLQTAQLLGQDPVVLLSLQHTGAAVGNAICLFNIIAAASIANLQNYKEVLARNLLPALSAAGLAGVLGWALLLWW